jgi:DNA-binding transcriptional regulator YdaS (Cro superfamily)
MARLPKRIPEILKSEYEDDEIIKRNMYLALLCVERMGSQTQLAELLGISKQLVCDWVNGRKLIAPHWVGLMLKIGRCGFKPRHIRPNVFNWAKELSTGVRILMRDEERQSKLDKVRKELGVDKARELSPPYMREQAAKADELERERREREKAYLDEQNWIRENGNPYM